VGTEVADPEELLSGILSPQFGGSKVEGGMGVGLGKEEGLVGRGGGLGLEMVARGLERQKAGLEEGFKVGLGELKRGH
jgi:hypothetical protein